jgi:SNF2-related domain
VRACCHNLCAEEVPGVSKATIIVCPAAIQAQWFAELDRHAPRNTLNVVTYCGQRASSLSSLEGARS